MDCKELRIGNYIRQVKTHNGFEWDKIRTVAAINKEGYLSVNVLEPNERGVTLSKLKIDKFSPIPLTEEWLVKFGFKKLPTYNQYQKGECFINIDYNKKMLFIYNGANKSELHYVHQLQNLYFALTGTEL